MIYQFGDASTGFLEKMNPSDLPISPVHEGRSVRRILWLIFLAGFAVILLVFGFWRLRLGGAVRSEVAAIRAKGLPVDWKDLEHWPMTVPDDRNAALVFGKALDMVDDKSRDKIPRLVLPVRDAAITNRDAIAEWVHSNAAAMEIIYGITNAASSRYPVEYTDGPNALLPHLAGIKTFAELFACDALLKADQKDSVGAARDIEASIILSQSLDAEPILISQLVSIAVLSITTANLERTFARTSLTDEQLLQLSKDFTTAEATNRFWMAMVGERASGNEMLRLLNDDPRAFIIMANKRTTEDEQTDVPPRYYRGYFISLSGFWVRDRDFFLRAMETNIVAFAATPPASLRFTNELDGIETNALRTFHMVSAMLLPAFGKVVLRDADVRAELRTAITAMAVERWRAAHEEKVPDSLTELVPDFLPAVPQDPFDGQPLRFKKLAKGYVVYSIGPNGQDDGGKERIPYSIKVPQEERNRYDITFIVER